MKRKHGVQPSSSSSSSFFSVLTQQPSEKYLKVGTGKLDVIRGIREEAETEKLKRKLHNDAIKLEKEDEEVQSSVRIYAEHAWSDKVELMKDLTFDFDEPADNSSGLQWHTKLGNVDAPLYMGHKSDDESDRQCGVLASIDSCWERRGRIFKVASLKSSMQPAEIDLKFNKAIESVTVSGPLKQFSRNESMLGLIVVFKDGVQLLLYSQAARTIHNYGLWAEAPKSAGPFSVAATECGRIFLGGNDGHIYELVFRRTRYLFGKRKVFLVSCTGSWIPFLDGIKSLVGSSPDPIIQLEVDESREVLYALRGASSTIDEYSISKERSASHFSYVRSLKNLYALAYNATPLLLLSRESGPNFSDLVNFCGNTISNAQECWESIWDTYFKRFVVSIHSIPKQASVSFSLVAITSQGAMLYFTPAGALASVVFPPFQPVPVSSCHVSGPCFHSDGTFVIPFTKEGPLKENFILCYSFMNICGKTIRPFEIYRIGNSEQVLGIHKAASSPKLDIPRQPVSISDTKKAFGVSHPCFSQYLDDAPKYLIETTEGLRVCGRHWPIDVFKRKILAEKSEFESDSFFNVMNPKEVYSMSLYIYSSTVGSNEINGSDKILLTKATRNIFESYTFGGKSLEELKTLRTDGAATFISRSMQPILDAAVCSSNGRDAAWNCAQLEEAYLFTMNAHNFLKSCECVCKEPKVLVGLKVLSIICETLSFIHLMCRKGEIFSKTMKRASIAGASLCLKDFITNKKVRSSVMTALVGVLHDTENGDALELMGEKCPFYFLCFKTSPAMKELYNVEGISSRSGRKGASLEDSLEYFINTPGIDVDFICTKYVSLNHHASALRLAIAKGEKLNQASESDSTASHGLRLRAKSRCYIIAIGILNNFNGPSNVRNELVKLALSFTGDKDWNEMIWNWCIKNGLKELIVKYSPRPLLVDYLLTRNDSYDIVCKCYMEDGRKQEAFELLVSSATSNSISMPITKRIDLLRNALGIAAYTKVASQQQTVRTQGILDVVTLQMHIGERLKAKSARDVNLTDIESKVLSLDVLIRDYAMEYKLYDLVIEAMKIGDVRRKDVVEKIYIDALFVQGLGDYSMPSILSLMGNKFYDKDDGFFFPVDFLLEQLFLRGFLNSDVVRRFRNCGVPYFKMFSYFRGGKRDKAAVLVANVCARDLCEGGDRVDVSLEQLLYMKDCVIKCEMSKDNIARIDSAISVVNDYNSSKKKNNMNELSEK